MDQVGFSDAWCVCVGGGVKGHAGWDRSLGVSKGCTGWMQSCGRQGPAVAARGWGRGGLRWMKSRAPGC